MTTPNYELLKDAYAIFDGIPEEAIDLDDILTKRGRRKGCGTVACGMGWLAMHPQFKAKGLSLAVEGVLKMRGTPVSYPEAAEKLFNIDWFKAFDLFGVSRFGESQSHRQALLRRIRALLGCAGQITNPEVLTLYEADLRATGAN